MAADMELAHVTECNVVGCGYNHDGCHASAITVGGHGVNAKCATFIPLGTKGGLDRVITTVGACQRGDCVHNDSLECVADSVRVGRPQNRTLLGASPTRCVQPNRAYPRTPDTGITSTCDVNSNLYPAPRTVMM